MLSPELYGVVGFTVSLMTIASLIMNFGFTYSATQAIAEKRDDLAYVSEIYSAVLLIKVLIGIALAVVLGVLVAVVDVMRDYPVVMAAYFLAYLLASLLPDYLYRGFEEMGVITVRTVAIRLASAVLIFVFLRGDQDVLVLPLSLVLGNAIALVTCFVYDRKVLHVCLRRVKLSVAFEVFKRSIPFFISRTASTVYQGMNAVILGLMFPAAAVVGWFNAADKVLSVAKSISSPVADSIYPYMIRNRDFKLAFKLLKVTAPFIIIACVLLFVFADQFCSFVFGGDYAAAGSVLRCLVPAMAVIFPTYLLCFPILVPMGLSKQANYSTIFGMIAQIAQLGILLLSSNLNVYTLCIASSVSEVLVFVFRAAVVIKHRDSIPHQ